MDEEIRWLLTYLATANWRLVPGFQPGICSLCGSKTKHSSYCLAARAKAILARQKAKVQA